VCRSRQQPVKLVGHDRGRIGAIASEAVRQALQQRVDRCRHAVQASQQDHLAVEVVGLDAGGVPGQALPGGATAPAPARNGLQPQQVGAPGPVLLGGGGIDTGRGEA
jgi:hypothetical protein